MNISSHSRLWDNRTRDISPTCEQDGNINGTIYKTQGRKHYETLITTIPIPYFLLHLRRMQRSKRKHSTRFFSLCCYYANGDGVNRAAFRGIRSIHAIN